jgi:hypothetical protein
MHSLVRGLWVWKALTHCTPLFSVWSGEESIQLHKWFWILVSAGWRRTRVVEAGYWWFETHTLTGVTVDQSFSKE